MDTPTLHHVLNRLNRIEERMIHVARMLDVLVDALVEPDPDAEAVDVSLDGTVANPERDPTQPL